MTNGQKNALRKFAKEGYTLEEIRGFIDCTDSTIKRYIKQFKPKTQPVQGK